MSRKQELKEFYSRVHQIGPRTTDTEEIFFESEEFEVQDGEQRKKFCKIAEGLNLYHYKEDKNKIIYMADPELGYGLFFYRANSGGSKIAIKTFSQFRKAFEKSNEKKGKLQRILQKHYPESTPRVYRHDSFIDIVIKDSHWLCGVDEIFPSFIPDKEKYPDSPFYSPVRWASQSLNKEVDTNPNCGFNDSLEPSRRGKKMTHMTAGDFTRQALKIYDKTNSESKLFLKNKITPLRYREDLREYGLVESGEHEGKMKRVIRVELMLKADYCYFLSLALTEARARKAKEKEQQQIIRKAVALWCSQHRLIDTSTIPESGDLSEAKTNAIYYEVMEMNLKTKSQKEEIEALAIGKNLSEDALNKIAPLPTPKREMDSIIKALAVNAKRKGLKGDELLDFANHYLPNKFLELFAELKNEEYKKYYYFYSQKLALSTNENEKDFYHKKIQEVKDSGFSIHHVKAIYNGENDMNKPSYCLTIQDYTDEERRLLGL